MSHALGILLSGSGSTYENLVDHISDGTLDAHIAVVISSRDEAGGLQRAKRLGHPSEVAKTPQAVTRLLRKHGAEWVACCGYMRYWDPPKEYANKTVNIHPSLLPAFGGRGMYGMHVHRAVLSAGCRISGCTVHLVSGEYDSGPIIAQQAVPVGIDDDEQSLQARVQEAERDLFPRALQSLFNNGLSPSDSGAHRLNY